MNPMMASLGNGKASALKDALGLIRNPVGAVKFSVMEKLKSHPPPMTREHGRLAAERRV